MAARQAVHPGSGAEAPGGMPAAAATLVDDPEEAGTATAVLWAEVEARASQAAARAATAKTVGRWEAVGPAATAAVGLAAGSAVGDAAARAVDSGRRER